MGGYTLRGRGSTEPVAANAGSFARATLLALVAVGGVALFHEAVTVRPVVCGAVILGGVALATAARR